MSLKAILDSLDGVNEALHPFYKEVNGQFILQVEGGVTEADIQRVRDALSKERNAHKATRDQLAAFKDLDPEDVLKQLDRIPELEAAAKNGTDDEKINALVEARIKGKTGPLEREIAKLTKDLGEATAEITNYKTKDRQRIVGDAIRKSAVELKMLPEAIEDALLLGERVFDIDEDGRVSAKDGGIEPHVWLTEMQQKRPHWWPQSQGGGAGGGRGNPGGNANPWTKAAWNLTEQGRIYRENPARAQQLAAAAGVKIGAVSPAA